MLTEEERVKIRKENAHWKARGVKTIVVPGISELSPEEQLEEEWEILIAVGRLIEGEDIHDVLKSARIPIETEEVVL